MATDVLRSNTILHGDGFIQLTNDNSSEGKATLSLETATSVSVTRTLVSPVESSVDQQSGHSSEHSVVESSEDLQVMVVEGEGDIGASVELIGGVSPRILTGKPFENQVISPNSRTNSEKKKQRKISQVPRHQKITSAQNDY